MTKTACIVLAAGKGTRMKSDLPKVMHKVAGRSLLAHVLTAANETGALQHCVVSGPDMPEMEREVDLFSKNARIVLQTERLGTGHAVSMAKDALAGFSGTILILYGDVPLIQAQTLQKLISMVSDEMPLAVLGFTAANPKGYGRLLCDDKGYLMAIREELDASQEERKVDLCNSGIMAVAADDLWPLLDSIGNDNANGEFYLTDIVGLTVAGGKNVGVAVCSESEVAGINDRQQLAAMEQVFQNKLRQQAMENGATLIAPETVFLSADTKIGRDVVIEPNVFMAPGVEIADSVVVHGFCHLADTRIGKGAVIGPFARLRPGTDLQANSKVGNFVEIKNATIHEGAKVNHLSYVGDATVGKSANIGAGTITCNYDGFGKSHTSIGAGAFIGSNSSLIAPVKIGAGAYVGSASVVTKDVPENALALARAIQENKPGWAERFRAAKTRKSKRT
ncbi:N-acetylglucosamine-1-phosphate uridyltransferase / Glucosamine-1-phosphate N-acetyltransferase [hydrothermal vent metagenome]|uniref:N-acetylglucosamine-1-phosphate uridyltransferase / Glucosamine-1-phosphate N-acetyltransferase n=1 Tax=hydrothermal vent metagenome TaxID=652676 RepID=A0A3B0RQR2_9ZZZZ